MSWSCWGGPRPPEDIWSEPRSPEHLDRCNEYGDKPLSISHERPHHCDAQPASSGGSERPSKLLTGFDHGTTKSSVAYTGYTFVL
ncbi:MAG: hypothetical protein FRX48_00890 [Lasallia pustulata]|uniref:Uncharacterized protein n=1 Tax=Lasallia pustulata TaxID=136370 RepID=A0A5M8Q440_9LECA|nr:MAG: hypothetical protein FRX48_00890 [Lasallia pustulata]